MKKKIIIIVLAITFIALLIGLNIFLNNQKNNQNEQNTSNQKILEITSENFEQEVLNSDKPVLIDFNADWCEVCKILSPTIEEISKENDNVKFVKINVDKEESLAIKYRIWSIPTLVLIENGVEKDRIVGLVDKSTLLEFIK